MTKLAKGDIGGLGGHGEDSRSPNTTKITLNFPNPATLAATQTHPKKKKQNKNNKINEIVAKNEHFQTVTINLQ